MALTSWLMPPSRVLETCASAQASKPFGSALLVITRSVPDCELAP